MLIHVNVKMPTTVMLILFKQLNVGGSHFAHRLHMAMPTYNLDLLILSWVKIKVKYTLNQSGMVVMQTTFTFLSVVFGIPIS